jgi:hypothetical protein
MTTVTTEQRFSATMAFKRLLWPNGGRNCFFTLTDTSERMARDQQYYIFLCVTFLPSCYSKRSFFTKVVAELTYRWKDCLLSFIPLQEAGFPHFWYEQKEKDES